MATEQRPRILIIRFVFFWGGAFVMAMANLPQPPQIPAHLRQCSVHHCLRNSNAFSALCLFRDKALVAFASLAALAAPIEIVQTIPTLRRDASILDWLADCGAVAVVMGIIAFASKVAGIGVRDTSTQS